ncbi:SMP-30/gluconolactonase/LRE family protein [Rhodohalobacter sp.]|uniref:SMP-30/gluconolactonase/LRE family protein n=1 Tax=Rhodohalobacter sp. TaxID=1974210 RepID=UPI002ACDB317|nr:SMP-30/gluconolactonase/LRE family protein [Rhodohalobacter sp.]MDZ7754957.1 SMP-30/gluconolactonase/LRE family protein [Rhodohalobacter sp.]
MSRIPTLLSSLTLFFLMFLFSCTSETEEILGEPEVITEGFQFTEGPYWHPDGYLLFSDIPANIIYKWEPGNTESDVYIQPSGNSNGITSSPAGAILLAQHSGKVSQINEDSTFTVLADQYDDKRLNSPNDIVARSDGKIFFTDPPFGVSDEDRELDFSGVYRLDQDGTLTLLFDGFDYPNGIALSPDESTLYVNDSATGQIFQFDLLEDGSVENQSLFASVGERDDTGAADGMKTDSEGRVYSSGPGGLSVFDTEGNRIQILGFDERITNLAWGGSDYSSLYVTAPNSVYRVQTNVSGR